MVYQNFSWTSSSSHYATSRPFPTRSGGIDHIISLWRILNTGHFSQAIDVWLSWAESGIWLSRCHRSPVLTFTKRCVGEIYFTFPTSEWKQSKPSSCLQWVFIWVQKKVVWSSGLLPYVVHSQHCNWEDYRNGINTCWGRKLFQKMRVVSYYWVRAKASCKYFKNALTTILECLVWVWTHRNGVSRSRITLFNEKNRVK